MKVTPEHLEVIRSTVAPLDTDEHRAAYREGRFPRATLVQDVDKRYRWDLFWAARSTARDALDVVLSGDYADAHLDTALRAVVPAL